jgi:hypothetical protein
MDAIVLIKDYVITVQMTVGSRHDAKRAGFTKVHGGLPPDFLKERTWFHVFVTDTEDKAKLLRKLQVKPVQQKEIRVYSAFIDIDELNPVITFDRADRLKEDTYPIAAQNTCCAPN